MENNIRVSIGSDHAGFELKETLKDYLEEAGYEIIDEGTGSCDSVDYPEYGHAIGKRVASDEADFGIAICGSGVGISISCNKVPGVRAALVSETTSARLARQHNDANVVAMGARLIGEDMAKEIVDVFLETEFEGGRHKRRVGKIES